MCGVCSELMLWIWVDQFWFRYAKLVICGSGELRESSCPKLSARRLDLVARKISVKIDSWAAKFSSCMQARDFEICKQRVSETRQKRMPVYSFSVRVFTS